MLLHQLQNRTCVNCNAITSFSVLHAAPESIKVPTDHGQMRWTEGPRIRAFVACGNCRQPSMLTLEPRPVRQGHRMHTNAHTQSVFLNRLRPLASIFQNAPENIKNHWAVVGNDSGVTINEFYDVVREFPSAAVQTPDESALPTSVSTQLNRLVKVLHEPVSAMFGCRRTLEIACKEKLGTAANGKKLYELIDAALADIEATKEISQWAHAIRHLGNEAAHDVETEPTEQDAQEAYEVVRLMLDLLFAYPARIRKLRPSP